MHQLDLFHDGFQFDEAAAILAPVAVPGRPLGKFQAFCPICRSERADFFEPTREKALSELRLHIQYAHLTEGSRWPQPPGTRASFGT